METNKTRIHPLMAGAAIAVILVSLVGVAAITGVLPGARGQAQPGLIDSTGHIQDANTPVGVALPTGTQGNTSGAATLSQNAQGAAPQNTQAPVNEPVPRQVAACQSCGTVESVQSIEHQARPSGVGAVAGALIGGVIGNRFGGGNGRALTTVAGAVGGGVAGNAIEKHGNTTVSYQVRVKMENGKVRTFPYAAQPGWNAGDRVQVVNGTLSSRN
ncbi:MAG TPA: glycine zipper 2TM domain-containing protein [Burkholderiaceae bacterium]|jgi:outer membrane lipoprotein SlyB